MLILFQSFSALLPEQTRKTLRAIYENGGDRRCMKATQIINAVKLLTEIKQPLFLWGPPGIGKSQVVNQAAAGMAVEVRDIRAILLDPVDLRGLPKINGDGTVKWCTPSFLPKDGEGILFLDELNAAPPLVQASCYQLVLDRRLGEYELPDGWMIIAAGNRESDRAVTHRMPSALANRFTHIDFTVDLEDWAAWAVDSNIAPEVISFIRFRPNLLHSFDPSGNEKAFPSPRSWEFVSNIVSSCSSPETVHDLVEGTVGKGAAAEFIGYLRIWKELPVAEEIFENPETAMVPVDPAVLFAVCEMLAHRVTGDNADALFRYAGRLPAEFSVMLIRDAVGRRNEIVNLSSFENWARRHADILV